jgi:hypothetical protein
VLRSVRTFKTRFPPPPLLCILSPSCPSILPYSISLTLAVDAILLTKQTDHGKYQGPTTTEQGPSTSDSRITIPKDPFSILTCNQLIDPASVYNPRPLNQAKCLADPNLLSFTNLIILDDARMSLRSSSLSKILRQMVNLLHPYLVQASPKAIVL